MALKKQEYENHLIRCALKNIAPKNHSKKYEKKYFRDQNDQKQKGKKIN